MVVCDNTMPHRPRSEDHVEPRVSSGVACTGCSQWDGRFYGTDRRMSATQESQDTPPLTCVAPNSNRSLLLCSSHQKHDARCILDVHANQFVHPYRIDLSHHPAFRKRLIASGISGRPLKPNGGQIDVAFVQPRLRVRRQPSPSRQEALLQVPLLARRRLACTC